MTPDTPEVGSPRGLSPHPDDKPAPLFASRPPPHPQLDDNLLHTEQEASGTHSLSQETIDTTLGQEGDSDRSIIMSGNDQSYANHFEYDIDGQPMVGDFLKMMFVEHHVVPTILVSKGYCICCLTLLTDS